MVVSFLSVTEHSFRFNKEHRSDRSQFQPHTGAGRFILDHGGAFDGCDVSVVRIPGLQHPFPSQDDIRDHTLVRRVRKEIDISAVLDLMNIGKHPRVFSLFGRTTSGLREVFEGRGLRAKPDVAYRHGIA